ncbi:MAG: acyl-CoA desaturase [Gammaproteobacteria bacterium]|nr:acyl-CoA desaturase [Gammaproteobacteria bacterium]
MKNILYICIDMSTSESINFHSTGNKSFSRELNQQVNAYFKVKGITKYADYRMVIKTVFMLSLFITPYVLLVSDLFNVLGMFILFSIMGVGKAGVGLSVMHDANHGSYSKYPWVNKVLGYTMNMLGGNATNWKIQHNVLHHSYTNIEGFDEDIMSAAILRFSPHTKLRKIHRYQYIYAWFLYGLMTITWLLVKDWKQMWLYQRDGLIKKQRLTPFRAWSWLSMTKVFYIAYMFVIPLLATSYAWYLLILGFILMHYITGFFLTIIFQPAHVVVDTEFPQPDQKNVIESSWAEHQLHTTANFAHKNKILSWFIGGLNYQIEHHLFPHICHIHYKKISSIVRETAAKYGLPYHSNPTFFGAIRSHGKLLKSLGRA